MYDKYKIVPNWWKVLQPLVCLLVDLARDGCVTNRTSPNSYKKQCPAWPVTVLRVQ